MKSKTKRNLRILELRRAGWTLRAIAKKMGVSANRVCQILAREEGRA